MRIAPHQIHNVLAAYAKRLKRMQDSINNGETPPRSPLDPEACSVEDKQRLIVSKISTKMIEQMVLTRHQPGPETNSPQTRNPRPRNILSADRFVYRAITPTGEKITAYMKIEDPGFLINPMNLARQDPEEDI